MRGDFSRVTFDPVLQFTRVLMQQGRVLLDADWNEQADLFLHYLRGLAADLIGPYGGPERAVGFEIGTTTSEGKADLTIGAGRYYVDGIACELPAPADASIPMTYLAQPSFPVGEADALPAAGPFLVYLDVWERHVSALEDDGIREPALDGPDTTTRMQVVAQVRVATAIGALDIGTLACATFPVDDFRAALAGPRPRLKARARRPSGSVDDDPCVTPADASYRGDENQLYRVEIHEVTAQGATFKWSRENGSIACRWLGTEKNRLTIGGVRDRVHGFEKGQWIELTDDRRELRGAPGVLVAVRDVHRDSLEVDTTGSPPIEADPASLPHARIRRWDHRAVRPQTLVNGALPVRVERDGHPAWVALEDGIEIEFQRSTDPARPDVYRPGDFWLIPARVATGDIIWPRDDGGEPLARPPRGIDHHYAPLAVVPGGGGAVRDLRRRIAPLAVCR